MNSNAAADFASTDKEIGADTGRSNYAYHQLTKRGIIKRATISMQNLPSEFSTMSIIEITNYEQFVQTSKYLLLDIIKTNRSGFDKYSFTCDIITPMGVMLISPITKNNNIETDVDELLESIKGISINTNMIIKIATGSLVSRFFDKTQTRQYGILISDYKYNAENIRNNINIL